MAFAAVKGLSQAAILSAPATAPVSSKTLAEAQQRARYFYREVRRWWTEVLPKQTGLHPSETQPLGSACEGAAVGATRAAHTLRSAATRSGAPVCLRAACSVRFALIVGAPLERCRFAARSLG
jgi:hypothetical protein